MKVLHVTPYFIGADAYGGIPRVATGQAKGLASLGHDLTVCTTDVRDRRRRHPASGRAIIQHGLCIMYFKNISNLLAYKQAYLPPGAFSWLLKHVRDYDLVHVHGHRHLLEVSAAASCLAHGVPWILQANGTLPRFETRHVPKKLFDLALGSSLARRCRAAIAVSKAEFEHYTSVGIPLDRIKLIPNGMDMEEFKDLPTRQEARALFGLPARGCKVLAFVAKTTPRKGLSTLVDAMKLPELNDAVLLVAGSDMGGMQPALRSAEALGLGNRIRVLGTLEGKERLLPLLAADVSVYAGSREIFGITAFESIMCGTPVVAADDSGCGEWLARVDWPWLVKPLDSKALAGKLIEAATAGTEALQALVKARKLITSRFSWPIVTRQLHELYHEITRNKESGTPGPAVSGFQ